MLFLKSGKKKEYEQLASVSTSLIIPLSSTLYDRQTDSRSFHGNTTDIYTVAL